MDGYKCCTFCLYIFELWDNKEVPLPENNYQGMVKITLYKINKCVYDRALYYFGLIFHEHEAKNSKKKVKVLWE